MQYHKSAIVTQASITRQMRKKHLFIANNSSLSTIQAYKNTTLHHKITKKREKKWSNDCSYKKNTYLCTR